jgi:hypothetical protein
MADDAYTPRFVLSEMLQAEIARASQTPHQVAGAAKRAAA